jgi:hypothetical protein
MSTEPTSDDLSRAAWVLRERLDEMKRHRGQHAEAELRAVAKEYIQAVYAWQITKYGRVVKPLGVAALLR